MTVDERPLEGVIRNSLPPQTGDLPPPVIGAPLTKAQAAELEDNRRPWHRAKWLTTTIGQVAIALALAACFAWLREAEVIRDALMYLALLTGGGQLSQGIVDTARARAGK